MTHTAYENVIVDENQTALDTFVHIAASQPVTDDSYGLFDDDDDEDATPRHRGPLTPAQCDLVTSTINLVGGIVRATMSRIPAHMSRDDLTSAALMALTQAAAAYNPRLNVPFRNYAQLRIRGAILDELRAADWACRRVRKTARDIEATHAQLTAAFGRFPTDAEIAMAMGVSRCDIAESRREVEQSHVLSIQGFETDGDTETFDDLASGTHVASPEATVVHREKLRCLMLAMDELPKHLRTVVQDYFFDDRSSEETAADMGVTVSRVSQLRTEALRMLKEAVNYNLDPELVTPFTGAKKGGAVERRRTSYYEAVAQRHAAYVRPRRSVQEMALSA